MSVVLEIGFSPTFTDYAQYLTDAEVEPTGNNVKGMATFRLLAAGGAGLPTAIKEKMEVRYYEKVGGSIVRRYFGGFIGKPTSTQIIGTNLYIVEFKCHDYNILLDTMRLAVVASGAVTDGGDYEFDHQLQRISKVVMTNSTSGSATIDIISGMALTDVLTGASTKVFSYSGISWRDALQKRMDAYQTEFPNSRPRFFIGLNTGTSTFGSPMLNVYDDAVTGLSSPVYTFSNAPTGTQRSVQAFKRSRDAIDLYTRSQATAFRDPVNGTYTSAQLSTNRTVYPNPYDIRPFGPAGAAVNAWEGPLVKLQDGSVNAQIDAAALKKLHAHENPRETIEITTDATDPVDGYPVQLRPGQDAVAVNWSLEGLSGAVYRVQKVRMTWQHRQGYSVPMWPVQTLTLGQIPLELGDNGEDAVGPVIEADVVPPDAPSSPAVTGNVFLQKNGQTLVTAGWTAPVAEDVAGYIVYWSQGGYGWTQTIVGAANTTAQTLMRAGVLSEFYVIAYDFNNNVSDPSTTVGFTTANGVVTDPTLFNFQTDTVSTFLGFYDTGGNLIAKAYADNLNHRMNIQGVLTSGYHNRVRLMSDSGNALVDVWDDSVGNGPSVEANASYILLQETTNSHNVQVASTGITIAGPIALNGPTSLGYSWSPPVVTITSSSTLGSINHNVRCNAAGGAFSATLPAATGSGVEFYIKKVDSSANKVTVAAAGTDKIDGAATYSLNAQYNGVYLYDAASGVWDIKSKV